MRSLLDTHVVLWFLNGERLTAKTKALIANGVNYISIVNMI